MKYEIRVGDGNQGCFPRCEIEARDMQNAINIVRRTVTNELKPYWRKQLIEEGDDINATLCIYPTGTWSAYDSCPYVVEINQI